ncbi:MAG: UbiD family decarboxylase [Limisphaerales bacterium]
MSHRSLRQAVTDLERTGQLVRIREPVDPHLEMAEIQRRVYAAGGPAIYYEQVKGTAFPAVSNLFGTVERAKHLLRFGWKNTQVAIRAKASPADLVSRPGDWLKLPGAGWHALPRKAWGKIPSLHASTRLSALPQIKSWPDDGGAYVLLPQVCTEDPGNPRVRNTNVGMYRVQISGGEFRPEEELGLHYQIHRGIGVHHARAVARNEPLKVSIFVGGPPAHSVAAVMPLPEGLSELMFAGMLAGRAFRYGRQNGHLISADADFVITGTISPTETKPEGPFGDHLGYYSLAHDFPVMKVDKIYHRQDAIWPFTVVGRPPQEDTSFGKIIHELTGPMVPVSIPGLHAMHAVDAAGVHPLLLAIGSERYVPYQERTPRELLTIANAVLGFGQASLAKYLFITAREDRADLDIEDIPAFFDHVLRRVDWQRDLHFQTRTTIDTLDYSGTGLNTGSKVIIAAAGEARRELAHEVPDRLKLPASYSAANCAIPGVLVCQGPKYDPSETVRHVAELADCLETQDLESWPLIVIVDDAEFSARNLTNFLWITFTRSNPSHDIHGVGSSIQHKHWGCEGPLIIDARIKPHHAPPLVEDPEVSKRVDEMAKKSGSLYGVI